MSARLSPFAYVQVQRSNDALLSGQALSYKLRGTSTATPVYSDTTLSTPITQPLTSDSEGRYAIHYLDESIAYKAVEVIGGVTRTYDPLLFASEAGVISSVMEDVVGAESVSEAIALLGGAYVLSNITVAESTTLTGQPPTLLLLLANHATGDGGGLFRLDSSDTSSSSDHGATLRVGQNGGPDYRYKRLVQDGRAQLSWWATGFSNSSTSTATAALNTALAWCAANAISKLLLPTGSIYFLSQPSEIASLIDIEGYGLGSTGTAVYRKYAGTTGVGLFRIGQGSNGTRIGNMSITADATSSGGCAISIVSAADPVLPIGQIRLHDMYTTTAANDKWTNVLYFDGTPNTGANSSGATGIREVFLDNVTCFGADGYSVVVKGINTLKQSGGGYYPAGGTNSVSGGINITGTAGVPSDDIYLDISDVDDVIIDYCTGGRIHATGISGALTATANCSNMWVTGPVSGAKTLAWAITCAYFPPDGYYGARSGGAGQQRMPSGTFVQWMTVSITTGGTVYPFPVAFGAVDTVIVFGADPSKQPDATGGFNTTGVSLFASSATTAHVAAYGRY